MYVAQRPFIPFETNYAGGMSAGNTVDGWNATRINGSGATSPYAFRCTRVRIDIPKRTSEWTITIYARPTMTTIYRFQIDSGTVVRLKRVPFRDFFPWGGGGFTRL